MKLLLTFSLIGLIFLRHIYEFNFISWYLYIYVPAETLSLDQSSEAMHVIVLNFDMLRCRLTGALATACGDDGVRVFREDLTADPEQPVFFMSAHVPKAHSQDINCVSWNPKEAGLLATCSDDGEFAIWKYNSDSWAGEWHSIRLKHWVNFNSSDMSPWETAAFILAVSEETVCIGSTGEVDLFWPYGYM